MNWRSFLILHGVENWRPREHWQWWLAHELRARGEQAFYPQLPAPSSPALDERTSPLRQDTSVEGRMSSWETSNSSRGTDAGSPRRSNVTR
jgi:predicted alpha/beta hydrolase family esterase